ncbi:MAG TPA: hypothetical protein DCG57_07865 [Candidatus Riflebacteria bacterium]|nr:hypothetical protein [Candidatus Riflebacteria bacterium]
MLIVQKLTKRFGTFTAVDQISFTIEPGMVYGFLGPNGAGKTTTIRMLTLESRPTSGIATFRGTPLFDNPIEYKRLFGTVSAEPFLYDHLTGREFLEFVADLRSLSASARASISDLLDRFEIREAADRLVAGYSSGMRRKISLIAGLLHDPPLLFLDEPTNSLDAVCVRRLKDLLLERKRAGVTIFLTTHILEVVEKLADRVGIIARGRLVAEGPLEKVISGAGSGDSRLEEVFLELTRTSLPENLENSGNKA